MVRAAALLALLGALIAWYHLSTQFGTLSLWPATLFLSLLVMPLCLLLIWLALPMWRHPRLLIAAGVMIVLAVVLSVLDVQITANFAKLFAVMLVGWVFLGYFEDVSWVVLVACLIPWIDAYSVWRGPTKTITEHHQTAFSHLSVLFVGPGRNAAQLGLPDILFFAVFLGASVRFALRPALTFVGLVAGLTLTFICAIWWYGPDAGLPALPGISLGFLLPNADLLWQRLRKNRGLTPLGSDPL